MASDPVLDHAPREGVRTFTPRWRNSPLTDERMATLLPARSLPEGPLVVAEAFGRVGPVVVEIGSGHGAAAIAYCLGAPRGRPRRRRGARARRGPDAGRRGRGRRPQPLGAPRRRDAVPHRPGGARLAGGGAPVLPRPVAEEASTRSGGSCSSTPSTCSRRGWCPGGVLRIATDIAAYAAHARAQLAHHGRWDVVEGERPDWRPDDGFEAKGVRAGRAVTELTCTLRPA